MHTSTSMLDAATFPFFGVAIALIVCTAAFENYIRWRQYCRQLQAQRPAQLTDAIVSHEKFIAAQAYTRDKLSVAFVKDAWDNAITLLALSFNILPAVWAWSSYAVAAVGLDADSETHRSIVFVFATAGASLVLDLPFSLYARAHLDLSRSISHSLLRSHTGSCPQSRASFFSFGFSALSPRYSTFVVEQRHGFNKQTMSLFFTDLVKSIAFGVALGAPILAAFLHIVKWGGQHFYLYAVGFQIAVQLFVMILYPSVIQPCFNKVEPLRDGALKSRIEALAARLNYPLKKLYEIDGSKRSSHSNAYQVRAGQPSSTVVVCTQV